MNAAPRCIAALAIAVIEDEPGADRHQGRGSRRAHLYPGVPIALSARLFKARRASTLRWCSSTAPSRSASASPRAIASSAIAGLSASFYTLAGQASSSPPRPAKSRELYNLTFVVSSQAYDGGLKSVKDLPGHDVAVTQLGTSLHYTIGLAAEKYGFPMSAINIRPLQSNSDVIAALTGGTIAVGVMPDLPRPSTPVEKGEIKRLAWVGDITLIGWAARCSPAPRPSTRRATW